MKKIILSVFIGVSLLFSPSYAQAAERNQKLHIGLFSRLSLAGLNYIVSSIAGQKIKHQFPTTQVPSQLAHRWGEYLVWDSLFNSRPVLTKLNEPKTIAQIAAATTVRGAAFYAANKGIGNSHVSPWVINSAGSTLMYTVMDDYDKRTTPGRIGASLAVNLAGNVVSNCPENPCPPVSNLVTWYLSYNTKWSDSPILFPGVFEPVRLKH